MKNTKAFKILTLALTLAVLAVGLCFIASAEEELSVSIIAKNVSYDDTVKVMFAVDDTNAGENEVELLYYLEDPTVNPDATAYNGEAYDVGYTSEGVTYPAFFSAGFPAKFLGDKVYARAHIVGTEVYSEVVRYSVVEYLLERLYVDMAQGDKKALYEDLLSYGASAQRVLINGNSDPADDITKFITDYVLVGIEGGTLDGKYDQGIYFAGDVINPQADGVATWNATVYDLSTGEITTAEVANAAEYTVGGFTMFTVATQGGEEPAPTPSYKPDLTDTAGRILWNELGTAAEYKSAGIIDHWINQGASAPVIEDGTPYGESSKVVGIPSLGESAGQSQFFINTTAVYANATKYVFETDMMADPDASCLYEINFRNKSVTSSQRTAYTIQLSVGTDGNGKISGSGLDSVTATGIAGNWFRFRAEYIDVSDTEAKVVVYYNDMKIGESAAFTKRHAVNALNDILITASSTSVGDLYLDNTKVAHEANAYVPTLTPDSKVETYEDGDALNTFRYDNDGTGAITDGTPYGTASKVYGFKGKETNFRLANGTAVYNGTDTFVFESDMMVNSISATNMYIEFFGTARKIVAYIVTDATGAVYLKDSSNSNVITPIAPSGEWFRLRIESKGTTVNFYINDVHVGATQSIGFNGETLNRLRFYMNSGSSELYFDNTKVLFVQ